MGLGPSVSFTPPPASLIAVHLSRIRTIVLCTTTNQEAPLIAARFSGNTDPSAHTPAPNPMTSDHAQPAPSGPTGNSIHPPEWLKYILVKRSFKESGCQLLVNKAQFLERENTTEYWTQLVKDQYRQESITLNLKRGIAIRKENLKQHNYYSQLMTDELKDIEQVNCPPSPSEEAKKRRRYNTRSAAAVSPSPSSSSSSATAASSSASSSST
ncbi:hypothetical protein BGX30_005974, partial [Mortierella sp. GBA39]